MNKTLALIGKVLLNILIGLLYFLTFIFFYYGVFYIKIYRKRYVEQNDPFKEL